MYVLLDTCQNPMILRIIYFASLLLDIVFVLVPIGLILMMMIDFSKVVIAGDDKAVKNSKLIGERIIYACILFCVPWIVNVLMNFLDSMGLSVSYRTCLTNAKSGNFDYYDELLRIEEEVNKSQSNNTVIVNDKKNNSSTKKDNKKPSGNGSSDRRPANNNSSVNKGDVTSSDEGNSGEVISSDGNMILAANSLVNTALGEVGRDNSSLKYGNSSNAWCAYFTTWALKNTKMNTGETLYSFLSKNGSISDGIASGLWPSFQGSRVSGVGFYRSSYYGGSYTPKIGDIIWFQWENGYCRGTYGSWNGSNKCADHVGIVTRVSGGTVYTVEGNSGKPGLVREKEYSTSSSLIIAYGSFY